MGAKMSKLQKQNGIYLYVHTKQSHAMCRTSNQIGRPISLNYSNRTGAYMNYWSQIIGEQVSTLIPKELQNELKKECDALIQKKQKLDYRNPKLTNKDKLKFIKIQDLIEPCNPTMAQMQSEHENKPISTQPDTDTLTMFNNMSRAPQKPSIDNMQTLVPTVFELDKKTNLYKINGEINDLAKEKNANLYKVIEKIFNCMEENIRKCVTLYPQKTDESSGHLGNMQLPSIGKEKKQMAHIQKQSVAIKKYEKYYVVIKMTDYQFMDGTESEYIAGNFHSEGFDEEHIKGVALYYFDYSDNIKGGGLSFKDPTYRHFGSSTDQSIGIKDNDCVFFTNDKPYKHKVDQMNIFKKSDTELYTKKDGEKVFATRKLLGMFIIDPNQIGKMKTTKDVIVNFEGKVMQIASHWMKKYEVEQNEDILHLICVFVCGDMKFVKMKTDEYRRQRYEFGQKVIEYDEAIVNSSKMAMAGVCD